MPLLDASDRQSAAWTKIKKHYEVRLVELRIENDVSSLTDTQTAKLRGRIDEVKCLLDLTGLAIPE